MFQKPSLFVTRCVQCVRYRLLLLMCAKSVCAAFVKLFWPFVRMQVHLRKLQLMFCIKVIEVHSSKMQSTIICACAELHLPLLANVFSFHSVVSTNSDQFFLQYLAKYGPTLMIIIIIDLPISPRIHYCHTTFGKLIS